MTGGTRIDEAQLSGMFDHVMQKPIDIEELIPWLERA
jgi:hypothetical protein